MLNYARHVYERQDFISRMLSEIEDENERRLSREHAAKWLGVPVRALEPEVSQ